MTQVAILGAGVAGLSAGWMLKNKGVDFIILEKKPYPGGLARSFLWNGFHCDFAAHRLFTTDEAVLHELLRLVPMGRHIRRSKIFLGGHWLRDPLDVLELSTHLSLAKRLNILWTYIFRPKKLPEDCFKNFVLLRYGKGLYKIFFQPYTEKLFGIPGEEISVLWARQKVRLANPLDSLRENTKTKFQYFYYPIREGYGAIVNKLYSEIASHVQLNTTVQGFETTGGQITSVIFEQDSCHYQEPIDAVISTLPLTVTGKMLGQNFSLAYKKVDSVYLHINRSLVSDYHWIYFIDQEVAINRLVEFKNMSPVDTPSETSVICAEVTQHHDDVLAKTVDDLVKVGLINGDEILDTKVIREEFAYPVYNRSYDQTLAEAHTSLGQYHNLFIVGRAAEFKHREADDNFAAASQTVTDVADRLGIIPPEELKVREPIMRRVPTEEPLVMAVVLAWNNYDDTHETLETLFLSQFTNFETVLVDNGSTDGTPEKVRQDFPKVHVIENGRNLGVPAGYNVGFRYALQSNAEYILMLNNDIASAPNMLSELLHVAQGDADTGIVMPKVLYYGSDNEVWSSGGWYRSFPPAIMMTDKRQGAADTMRLIEYAPSCVLLIHRRAFESAGLFDPGYLFLFDDWDFSERVRAYGLKIWYTPKAKVWHKVSRSTKGPASPLFWRTWASSTVRYYRRHGRPAWLSVALHISYMILREFLWKRNWTYWKHFRDGIREGLQKPLGAYPIPETSTTLEVTKPNPVESSDGN